MNKSVSQKGEMVCCEQKCTTSDSEEKNNCCDSTGEGICHCVQLLAVLNSEGFVYRVESLDNESQFVYKNKKTLKFNSDHFHPPEFTS